MRNVLENVSSKYFVSVFRIFETTNQMVSLYEVYIKMEKTHVGLGHFMLKWFILLRSRINENI